MGMTVKVTGKADIRMDYVYYIESIVVKYGVELIGWPCDRFVNPSDLSSSLTVLTTVSDALKDGACKWVKLSSAERKAREANFEADVAAGKITRRERNPRSDIGKKRKATAIDDDEDDDADEQSASDADGPIVEEPGEDTVESPARPPAPPAKRHKTSTATKAKSSDSGKKHCDHRDRGEVGEKGRHCDACGGGKDENAPCQESCCHDDEEEAVPATTAAGEGAPVPVVESVPIDPALVAA
ncbi:hypothetical protein B0H14DRAFT_3731711 [Mycena olivaceomarginata]|nr:hypothetical protein B0H14DRAFT_3731711 [Mycena olivaceomarginata]